jgi:flagellar biosynthesis/type III secretory pathway protein FliH
VESSMLDPNAQLMLREWQAKEFAKGLAEIFTVGFAESYTKGFTEGIAKGRADEARLLLYRVLAARAIAVTPDARARIEREHDPARLEAWLVAAISARAIGDVLRDG